MPFTNAYALVHKTHKRLPKHRNDPSDEDIGNDIAEIPNNRSCHDEREGYSDVALRQIHFADLDKF